MSLYIHSENQKILWDSIQKSPLCNLCFNNDEQKNLWFKSIIRLFYEKNPKKIGNVELTEMNHKTIVYMLNDMKTLITTLQTGGIPPSVEGSAKRPLDLLTASNTISNSSSSNDIISNTSSIPISYQTPSSNIYNYDKNKERDERIKTIEMRLVEKQYEMESLLKRPSPPEIDFRMVEKDEPIINIDELMQKHIRERELYQEIPHQLQPTSSTPQDALLGNHIYDSPRIKMEGTLNTTDGVVDLSYKLDKLMDMMNLIDYKLTKILNKETALPSYPSIEQVVENIEIEPVLEQIEIEPVVELVEIEPVELVEIEPVVEKKTEFKRGRGRGRGKR